MRAPRARYVTRATQSGYHAGVEQGFFEQPILNSPYEYPARHWELDENRQPTNRIVDRRRSVTFITRIPAARKQRTKQAELGLDDADRTADEDGQQYELMRMIESVRHSVGEWRRLPRAQWRVTPETARLLDHWRHHQFSDIRPFFCQVGLSRVLDLSATPFFLRGSGYAEGTLFPWTMSDFSLMDAIECGIVKLPRVPVADNIPGADMPKFRNLWEHIGTRMPRKGRGKSAVLDPLSIPVELQTALEALYGHYVKIFDQWREAGIDVPPCFIVVCNNTATSKLVYDYISGFQRQHDDGSSALVPGRLELFRNFDDYGNPLAKPHTLLIDSEQLDSGEALGKDFRAAATDEIERFRREIITRTGDRRQAESLSDQDLLREVMNTVGVADRLGRHHPLRGIGIDAHRGLGRAHRHPHSRGARVRHATPVRAGSGPRPAAPVLRSERRRRVRRRIRRCARHPVRLHRRAGGGQEAEAARDRSRQGDHPGPGRLRRIHGRVYDTRRFCDRGRDWSPLREMNEVTDPADSYEDRGRHDGHRTDCRRDTAWSRTHNRSCR